MFFFEKDLKLRQELNETVDKEQVIARYIAEEVKSIRRFSGYKVSRGIATELVRSMMLLSFFYNRMIEENYGEYNYPTVEDVKCFVNEARTIQDLKMRLNYYDPARVSVTLLDGDEEVLAIRCFEEDRLDNEALVSLSHTRGEDKKKFSLIAGRFMLGGNGIYRSCEGSNFIKGIKDTDEEAFSTIYPFRYTYHPFDDSKCVQINRGNRERKVFCGTRHFDEEFNGVYDFVLVGGMPKSDQELYDYVYTSRLQEKGDQSKRYVKK